MLVHSLDMRRLGYKFASAKPQSQLSDGYTNILYADEKEDDTLLLIMQTYDYFFENHIFLTIK